MAASAVAMGCSTHALRGSSDFLGLLATRMVDYVKRFGLISIPHEGTFWEAEAGFAYLRTNRPARMIESFKSMVRAAVSA